MAYNAISKAIGAASHNPMARMASWLENTKSVMRSYISYTERMTSARGFI